LRQVQNKPKTKQKRDSKGSKEETTTEEAATEKAATERVAVKEKVATRAISVAMTTGEEKVATTKDPRETINKLEKMVREDLITKRVVAQNVSTAMTAVVARKVEILKASASTLRTSTRIQTIASSIATTQNFSLK
jgi:hypothetical protein